MKTAAEYTTTLGILDAQITVVAEINEKDENQYNQLILEFTQEVDAAFLQTIKIPVVSKEQILELADNIKKLAKHFPSETK